LPPPSPLNPSVPPFLPPKPFLHAFPPALFPSSPTILSTEGLIVLAAPPALWGGTMCACVCCSRVSGEESGASSLSLSLSLSVRVIVCERESLLGKCVDNALVAYISLRPLSSGPFPPLCITLCVCATACAQLFVQRVAVKVVLPVALCVPPPAPPSILCVTRWWTLTGSGSSVGSLRCKSATVTYSSTSVGFRFEGFGCLGFSVKGVSLVLRVSRCA
jgi:hypothetical protein